MKTQNELFIEYLNENIGEVKDVLIDVYELEEDNVKSIVKFDGNNYDGYYGVDKNDDCVTFGCDIFESLDDNFEEDNGDDVSIGTSDIGVGIVKEIYFVCYNSNNNKKIVKELHKRSKVGKYKDIQLSECEKQLYGNDYVPNFNIYTLKAMAREDNFNNKYQEYFNKDYDAYDFEYNNLDDKYLENTNKLNYTSISKYFENEKLCVLKSPYGTGKTTYMTKLINYETITK